MLGHYLNSYLSHPVISSITQNLPGSGCTSQAQRRLKLCCSFSKPRCLLDEVCYRLLGYGQPCRAKVVAKKIEAALDPADECLCRGASPERLQRCR
jgi:hypothetical protein